MKCNDTDVKFLPTLATSCCVIHICEIQGSEFDEDGFVSGVATLPTTIQVTATAMPIQLERE